MTRFDPPLVMAQAVMGGPTSPQLRASGSGHGELDAPEGAGLFDPSLHAFPPTPRSPASTALAASLAASHYEMVTTKQFSPLATAMSQQLREFNNLEHQLKTNGHQSGLSLNQLQHQPSSHTMAATATLPHPHLASSTSGPSAATLAALVEDLGNGDGADLPAMYSQRLWLQQPREVNIVFGRDVIQVPLKVENSNNEYVNLVLSHREFDVMAVHIPKYDEMPPTELLDEITRNLKEQLEKQKSRRNAFPLSNQLGEFPDSNATFQARILELEYELSRLNTKLTAARALQTTLTDENTLLRSNIQDLEQRCVENETLKMQNEALRDQSVVAFSQNGKLKQLLTATTQELKTLSRQVQSLRTQVHFEKSEIAMQVDHSMNALIANVRDREHVLQESYLEEKKERQLIAEKYYEISGRIRVFCRLRPVTRSLHKAASSALLRPKPNALLVDRSGKEFSFDQVFGPENSQADVYAQMEPVVISFVDGYNACIMAYGQTGSGKTFTMMGGSGEFQGMIPRALQQVFSVVNARQLTYKDTLNVSMVEIYNDQILDLLTESESGGKIKNESDITLRPVTLWEHVNAVLAEGNANRNIASTSMNLESSRSHALVFLNLESQHRETMEIRKSTLCLVDLAGSERISRSQVEGDRLKETQHINKSLSALGDVMHALQHKAKHVPYRNSKLTYMLREMLSGHAKTLMMLQLSPEDDDIEETICSLQFGARVSQIQMGAVKTSIESGAIFKLKEENRMLEKRIAELEEQSSAWKFERRSTLDDLKDVRDRNQKLQAQLGQQHDDMTQLQEKLEAVSVVSAVSESPPRSPLKQDPPESTTPLSPTYSANSARSMRSAASTSSAPAAAPGTPGTSRYGAPSAAARPTRTGGLGSSVSTRANLTRPLPRSVPKDTASTTPPPAPTSAERLARRKSLTTLGSQSAATILTARERLARAANDPDAQSNRRATLGAIGTSSSQSNSNAAASTPASSRVRQALAKDPEVQSNRRASLGAIGTSRSQPNLNAATPTPANSRVRTPAAPSTPSTPATPAGSSSTRPAPMRRINSLSTPKSTPASAAASPSRTGSSLRPPSSLEQSASRSSTTLRTPSTLEQRRGVATSRASPSTSRSGPSATRTRPTGTAPPSATRTEKSRRSPSTYTGA